MGNEKGLESLKLAANIAEQTLCFDLIGIKPTDEDEGTLIPRVESSDVDDALKQFTPYTPTDEEIKPLLGDKRKREDFDFTRHGNLIRARTKPRTWLKLAGREFEIDLDNQTCLLVRMN